MSFFDLLCGCCNMRDDKNSVEDRVHIVINPQMKLSTSSLIMEEVK
jgi:hypothetical protein